MCPARRVTELSVRRNACQLLRSNRRQLGIGRIPCLQLLLHARPSVCDRLPLSAILGRTHNDVKFDDACSEGLEVALCPATGSMRDIPAPLLNLVFGLANRCRLYLRPGLFTRALLYRRILLSPFLNFETLPAPPETNL
jgi:hypothetical protein